MTTLTIYFDNTLKDETAATAEVRFVLRDGERVTDQGTAPLDQLQNHIADIASCETTVVIPGEQVISLYASAPKGSRRHIEQALPYLLEDELATPVESLHIAHGETTEDGKILCAVIDRELLQDYLQMLAPADITATRMIPDYWTLPVSDQVQTAKCNHRLLVRHPSSEGLALLMPDADTLNKLIPDADVDTYTDTYDNELDAIPEWQLSHTESAPFNLLQGDFAPAKKSPQLAWLKPTAIAAGVALLLFISYFLAAGWYFNQQASELMQQAETRYRELFPNDKKIIDLRRQMQAHLNQAGNGQSRSMFFELLNSFTEAKKQQAESSTIRNIRFDQKNSSLQMELQANSINYANNLQNQIEKSGLNAEVLSANSNDAGVIARLRIQPEGAE